MNTTLTTPPPVIDLSGLDDDQIWQQVDTSLSLLRQQLESVPATSEHYAKGNNILNKVRAMIDDWETVSDVRRAGRPQGVFLTRGSEEVFVGQLTAFFDQHYDPQQLKVRAPGHGYYLNAELCALSYDLFVKHEIGTGVNDLKCFHQLWCKAARMSKHQIDEIVTYNSVSKAVKSWEQLCRHGKEERVLLHRIQQRDLFDSKAIRQKHSSLIATQEKARNQLAACGLLSTHNAHDKIPMTPEEMSYHQMLNEGN